MSLDVNTFSKFMQAKIRRTSRIQTSGRVLQLRGMFDIPPADESSVDWTVNLPIESQPWQVGLIVGASGTGKSTIARELFGPAVVESFEWPPDKSLLDAFPAGMSIKEITLLLSSVGFSSPPSWLRPFDVLSTGEKFRATVARALAEAGKSLLVIDEFTSVVDRTVAQIGSAAIAKAVRRTERQFIAVTCHYDVIEWLQPDWIYEPAVNSFQWRSLRQRPAINMEVRRVHSSAWSIFKQHHYLTGEQHKAAACFVGFIDGRPAGYISVIHFPHAVRPGWKEHRSVVLPDFQGVGIGNRLSEFVASMYVATGKPYRDTTGHPGHVYHRKRSPLWRTTRTGRTARALGRNQRKSEALNPVKFRKSVAVDRITWSFEYIGPADPINARRQGVLR